MENFNIRVGQITSSINNVFASESSQAIVSIVDNDGKSLCTLELLSQLCNVNSVIFAIGITCKHRLSKISLLICSVAFI